MYACTYDIVVPILLYGMWTPIVLVLIDVEIDYTLWYACINGIVVHMLLYGMYTRIALVHILFYTMVCWDRWY